MVIQDKTDYFAARVWWKILLIVFEKLKFQFYGIISNNIVYWGRVTLVSWWIRKKKM